MCKSDYMGYRLVGKDLNVVNAGTGDIETTIKVDSNDGDVIGFSTGESYSRMVLAKTLLTIAVDNGDKVFINVPLTQLLPDGERQMWPLQKTIPKASTMKVTLTCRDNTLATANPIVLICHHKQPDSCSK